MMEIILGEYDWNQLTDLNYIQIKSFFISGARLTENLFKECSKGDEEHVNKLVLTGNDTSRCSNDCNFYKLQHQRYCNFFIEMNIKIFNKNPCNKTFADQF